MKICVFFTHMVLFDIIKYKGIMGIKIFLGQNLLLVPFDET